MDPREGAGGASSRIECASDVLYFRSVEEAVAAAAEGDVVALVAGAAAAAAGAKGGAEGALVVHSGRAVLSKPGITLTTLGFDLSAIVEESEEDGASLPLTADEVAASAGPAREEKSNRKRATLSHETPRPYESTVAVAAPGCRVVGLNIRHSSPSVANNYALHVEEGAASADSSSSPSSSSSRSSPTIISECDVASSSGSAMGLDAAARVSRCRLASSSRFGAAVFAPGPPRTRIHRCELSGGGGKGSKGDVKGGGSGGGSGGLLVRGADVEVKDCLLSGDPLAMRLVDGTGVVSGCVVEKGRVEEGVAWEGEVVV